MKRLLIFVALALVVATLFAAGTVAKPWIADDQFASTPNVVSVGASSAILMNHFTTLTAMLADQYAHGRCSSCCVECLRLEQNMIRLYCRCQQESLL